MAHFAIITDHEEDQTLYQLRMREIAQAINAKFFNPETAQYALGSQASNVFALYLGIVPDGYEARVAKNVADDVIAHGCHLTTGNVCTKFLPEVLSQYGYIDLAYQLMCQTTYPSYGYMRAMGATTIWERWEYADGVAMNSHAHPMFGCVTAWFYQYLAGIRVMAPGFEHFLVHPYMPKDLPSAGARIQTLFGEVVSEWKQHQNGYELTVKVPCSAWATITLPGAAEAAVTLNGEPLKGAVRRRDDLILMEVRSGTHVFQVEKR